MTVSHIYIKEIPDPVEVARNREPYYWTGLEANKAYPVVSDYEKLVNGVSKHFFLINVDDEFKEIPVEGTAVRQIIHS